MQKRMHRFTLVEMLTVIAIISILAGLIIPVVVIAQERGRETQAKSDIAALMSALKQVETDYGRILKKDGSDYKMGDKTLSASDEDVGSGNDAIKTKKITFEADNNGGCDEYDALICELSAPKNKGITVSVNKRKKMYLEPKKGFDPAKDYDADDAQKATLWRDPWGNPYKIFINVAGNGALKITNDKSIATDIAIYSFGPNGTDDKGCNVALDTCITGSGAADHKLHDDIASWDL